MLGGESEAGKTCAKGLSLIPEQLGKGATAATYSDRDSTIMSSPLLATALP